MKRKSVSRARMTSEEPVCARDDSISFPNANTKATSAPLTGSFTHSEGEILPSVYDNGTFAYLEWLDAIDSQLV